jgi:hypothetical protein
MAEALLVGGVVVVKEGGVPDTLGCRGNSGGRVEEELRGYVF